VCIAPDKADDLSGAILRLKNNQAERDEMGRNGRHLLETQFSREHCVDMYEAMFEQFARMR